MLTVHTVQTAVYLDRTTWTDEPRSRSRQWLQISRGWNVRRQGTSNRQGGETTLVAQPYLGDRTIDYRIYMIGGQPYPYCLRRTPLPGSPVSNASL